MKRQKEVEVRNEIDVISEAQKQMIEVRNDC